MERSDIRDDGDGPAGAQRNRVVPKRGPTDRMLYASPPDFASLNPGYACLHDAKVDRFEWLKEHPRVFTGRAD